MRDYLEDFRKVVVYTVIVMIAFVIVLTLIGLIISMYNLLFVDKIPIEDRQDFLTFIGNFLIVVISVELLDTLYLYIKKHKLFPELILLVVLTAVAREVLVTDVAHTDPILLIGIGIVLIAIAASYYLVKRAAWEADAKGEEDGTRH
jgi:uncharacterized membrane protein (DUF373 family)